MRFRAYAALAAFGMVLVLNGCGEKTEVGDNPAAANARSAADPAIAEKRRSRDAVRARQNGMPPPQRIRGD